MSIEVEAVVAISVMMAVFSAVAAIGTGIVLGAGFERLRIGFEVICKQTGFFSDAINRLEEKMAAIDSQTGQFSRSISTIEGQVLSVSKQNSSFTDAINRLENKFDNFHAHEEAVSENIEYCVSADVVDYIAIPATKPH